MNTTLATVVMLIETTNAIKLKDITNPDESRVDSKEAIKEKTA